jgi:hypothetical protein
MPRSMVGLLAAVGAAMSVLAGRAYGYLFWALVVDVAAATGLAAYMALPPNRAVLAAGTGRFAKLVKKNAFKVTDSTDRNYLALRLGHVDDGSGEDYHASQRGARESGASMSLPSAPPPSRRRSLRCELLAVGPSGVVRASRAFASVLMGTVGGGTVAALWCCTTLA